MNFNSIEFLLFFLPIFLVLLAFSSKNKKVQVIAFGSAVFYLAGGAFHFVLLIATTLWGYFCGKKLNFERSLTFIVAATPPLLALFIFKYLGYASSLLGVNISENSGYLSYLIDVSMPAGISFYTFEIISYFFDIKDGKIAKEDSFLDFASFVLFFPHLIAGPIMRYWQFSEQIKKLSKSDQVTVDYISAIKYLIVGLAYKTFFSDVLRTWLDIYKIDQEFNSIDGFFHILAYSVAIYYDFWGYSLMAIGLGMLCGIALPRNFNEPYMSKSPKEFWRRWHVTLSFWIRDYVYLKLGGNRHYLRNIAVIFTAVGIWHGAGTNFIIWGLYHGALVCLYHISAKWWDAIPKPITILTTFTLVSIGWPLFYLDINQYIQLIAGTFSFSTYNQRLFGLGHWAYLFFSLTFCFSFREDKWLFSNKFNHGILNPMYLGLMAFIALMFSSYAKTFIYFQF